MATDHILALLLIERDKLTAAIEALQGPTTREKTSGPGRKAVLPPVEQDSKPPARPVRRKMSAAGRRAIMEGTKKRWAAIKAAKAAVETPAPAAPVPVASTPKAAPQGGITAAGRKALSLAMKKRWAAKSKS